MYLWIPESESKSALVEQALIPIEALGVPKMVNVLDDLNHLW